MKTSESIRSFLAIVFATLFCLFYFTGRSQNYFTNSSDWNDNDCDGLGDKWYVGPFTNEHQIDNGRQYAGTYQLSTCNQVRIGQVLDMKGAKRTFTISFDLASSQMVQLCVFHDNLNGYLIQNLEGGVYKHYTITFTYTNKTLYSIDFITGLGHPAWLSIDNVVLTDDGYKPVPRKTAEYAFQQVETKDNDVIGLPEPQETPESLKTGIQPGQDEPKPHIEGIYDLLGRKLSREPESGVYVKNGVKYLRIKN